MGGRVHSRHDPGHSCLAGRQLRVLSRPHPALYGRTRTRLLRAAGEPAGDEELEHHATGDEERFERDAERLMGQMGGEMDEEEAGQMLEGLEGFDEEALRNLGEHVLGMRWLVAACV